MTNTLTDVTFAPAPARADSQRGRVQRVDRGTIVLTSLSVVFALLVLLQMLPGTGGPDDATAAQQVGTTITASLFVAGAVTSMTFIAALLLRATRRADH